MKQKFYFLVALFLTFCLYGVAQPNFTGKLVIQTGEMVCINDSMYQQILFYQYNKTNTDTITEYIIFCRTKKNINPTGYGNVFLVDRNNGDKRPLFYIQDPKIKQEHGPLVDKKPLKYIPTRVLDYYKFGGVFSIIWATQQGSRDYKFHSKENETRYILTKMQIKKLWKDRVKLKLYYEYFGKEYSSIIIINTPQISICN